MSSLLISFSISSKAFILVLLGVGLDFSRFRLFIIDILYFCNFKMVIFCIFKLHLLIDILLLQYLIALIYSPNQQLNNVIFYFNFHCLHSFPISWFNVIKKIEMVTAFKDIIRDEFILLFIIIINP